MRETMRFDGSALSPDALARLRKLEERARPQTLVEKVRAIVLNENSSMAVDWEPRDDASSSYERAEQLARELGECVASDAAAFATLLPLVVVNQLGQHRVFGGGLASGTANIMKCWNALIQAYEATPQAQRNVEVLRGFLSEVFNRDRDTFERLLDAAMQRTSLVRWVPVLQLGAPLDQTGCLRLLASMDNQAVSAGMFQELKLGGRTHGLEDRYLAALLRRLSLKPDGASVAIQILSMHIFDNPNPVGKEVTEVARTLILSAAIPNERGRWDDDGAIAQLIAKFLAGPDGESAARRLGEAWVEGFSACQLSECSRGKSMAALFAVQPEISLDTLVGDDTTGLADQRRDSLVGEHGYCALTDVPIETIVQWCSDGPPSRWARVAPLVAAFALDDTVQCLRWTDRTLALLRCAPNPIELAEPLVASIYPRSWTGSRAESIRKRLPLLDELGRVLGMEHAQQIEAWRNSVLRDIDRESEQELRVHQAQNERFE